MSNSSISGKKGKVGHLSIYHGDFVALYFFEIPVDLSLLKK